MDFIVGHFNYWVVITLMMLGLYVVISTGNLVKRLVGLGVFQTSVFQLYITMGKVTGGRPPILENLPEHGAEAASGHGEEAIAQSVAEHASDLSTQIVAQIPENPEIPQGIGVHDIVDLVPDPVMDPLMGVIYSNPVPHVLILTAIVVGVATLAVGLAMVVRIREAYGSIEESEIDEAEYKIEVKSA